MITLYGQANSRAFRCLWMLEELERSYEHVPTDFARGVKDAEYLRLNPNGRIPCLVDGELVLFESLAINLYLARRYQSPLWPAAIEDEARTYQWTLWATNELDPSLSALARQQRLGEAERDATIVAAAEAALPAPMGVLEAQLSGNACLLGAEFSLADLNVASALSSALATRTDLRPFPRANAWLRAALQRPAAQRAVAKVMADR
jgi:glutathione S-transferase